MPTLFIDRPIHAILTIVVYDAIFIILCFMNKEGAVLSVDCMDAVVFGILGAASGAVINHMKIRGYVSELKLQEIGRIDQLTQMNNRNAYELDLFSVTEKCRFSLACLYVDANGLHELNNEKGHEAGDNMLKFIAEQVCDIFSDELSYRIGGDEFVAFVPDSDVDSIQVLVSELTDRVEKNGYHIAAGYEIMSLRHIDIRGLIKAAESRMKFSKDEFYRSMNRKTRNN